MQIRDVLVILFALTIGSAAGQNNLIRVRAGHAIGEEFPRKMRYRYENFQPGKVIYVSGKASLWHLFNYDYLMEAVETIQPTGDTIVIDDKSDFKYFKIKDAVFFRTARDKYVEVIASDDSVKLAVRENYIMRRRDKKVSDGYNTFVDNVNSVHSLTNMGYGRMIYDQDLLMQRREVLFIIDRTGTVYKANKGRFLKIFSPYREALEKYIERNSIDFHSRESMSRLFEYVSALRTKV